MASPYNWIDKSLDTIHRANWYRSVRAIAGKPGAVIELSGKPVINFASNDYLGLAGDSRLNSPVSVKTDMPLSKSTGEGYRYVL